MVKGSKNRPKRENPKKGKFQLKQSTSFKEKIIGKTSKNKMPGKMAMPCKTAKSNKRKLSSSGNNNSKEESDNLVIQNFNIDTADEVLLKAKKQKLDDAFKNVDKEDVLFAEIDFSDHEDDVTAEFSKKKSKIKTNAAGNSTKNIQHLEKQSKLRNEKANPENVKSKSKKEPLQGSDTLQQKKLNTINEVQNKPMSKKEKLFMLLAKNKSESVDNKVPGETKASSIPCVDKLKTRDIQHKAKLKEILNMGQRTTIRANGESLRERMLQRLKAAHFRILNEKLYTTSGSDAIKMFNREPKMFQSYHEGFQQQVKKWPINPLDVIIKQIHKMPRTHLIADMGCGQAALARRVPHTVRSFDLVAATKGVEVCDMANTPLKSDSMDVVVYCLALMGTEITKFLMEANRVLKKDGQMLIAEVESRFHDVKEFIADVEKLGFRLKSWDESHKLFYFFNFTKTKRPKGQLPELSLKPCIYKRR